VFVTLAGHGSLLPHNAPQVRKPRGHSGWLVADAEVIFVTTLRIDCCSKGNFSLGGQPLGTQKIRDLVNS
jgi:hypothetical protein